MSQMLTEYELDHGTYFPEIEDPGKGRHLRCNWQHSVCTETVEYRIEYLPLEGQQTGDFFTFCPRHYVLSLATLLENHDMHCNIPIYQHLRSYGRVEDPIQTGL